MSEFNLSDKRWFGNLVLYQTTSMGKTEFFYREKDVKEFILRENNLIVDLENREITWEKFWKERKKLAGEELSK